MSAKLPVWQLLLLICVGVVAAGLILLPGACGLALLPEVLRGNSILKGLGMLLVLCGIPMAIGAALAAGVWVAKTRLEKP